MNLLAQNLTQPPVLFFLLGAGAALAKSDLKPAGMSFLVLYLLAAIGLRGGVELSHAGITAETFRLMAAALGGAIVLPFAAFGVLRRFLDRPTAAATAAAYGSVSAVTFLAAVELLKFIDWPFGGHMVAALALMEWPAILVGVLLAGSGSALAAGGMSAVLKKGFTCGSVVVLVGSLLIGYAAKDAGWAKISPFFQTPFAGALCLFLLGLGIEAGRSLGTLRFVGLKLAAFAILFPIATALLALGLGGVIGAGRGDVLLLMTLYASASYIAVPAAMRLALPEADPAVYLTGALAITFPFNVLIGIPVYALLVRFFIPS